MTFEDFLKLTRRQAVAIAVGLLAGLIVALIVVLATPVSYKAYAEAYVRVEVSSNAEASEQTNAYYAASQLANQKSKAFVPVFTSETVAQGVVDSLGLSMTSTDLSRSLSVSNQNGTSTIGVTATASSEDGARRVADEVVRQSAAQIRVLEGDDSPVEVMLMSPSSQSGTTRSPSVMKYIGIGLLVGILLGYALALAREVWDKRVRSAADVAVVVDRPVLGVIPVSDAIARGQVGAGGGAGAEEAFRKLRTNLRYANVDKGVRSFVVTSGVQGDGKSTVASNLARVMALAGQGGTGASSSRADPASGRFDLLGRVARSDRGARPPGHSSRRSSAQPVRAPRLGAHVGPGDLPGLEACRHHRRAGRAAGHRCGGARRAHGRGPAGGARRKDDE